MIVHEKGLSEEDMLKSQFRVAEQRFKQLKEKMNQKGISMV